MEGYCIWFKESAVNKLLSTGYQSDAVKAALQGTATIAVAGAPVDIKWVVSKEPSVSFRDIDTSLEVLDETGNPLAIEPEMFTVTAAVTLSTNEQTGTDAGSEIPITLVSKPELQGQSVDFRMVGLLMDSSYKPSDRAILKGVCQDLLGAINKALGFDTGNTPSVIDLGFLKGLGLDFPNTGITRVSGKIGVWSRDEDGDLTTVIPDDMDVGFVITDGAYSQVLTQQFRGQMTDGRSGYGHHFTYSTFLGDIHGSVVYSINNVECVSALDDILDVAVDPSIECSADAKFLISAVAFDCKVSPDPIHARGLATVYDGIFSGTLDEFSPFSLSMKGKGGGFSAIEEALIKKAVEYFANKTIDAMRGELKIPFSVQIPQRTIPTGIASIQVKLCNYESFTIYNVHSLYALMDVSLGG